VYGKITNMLSDALSKPVPNPTPNLPPVPHTMLDLLLLLLPFLPPVPASQIFDQALTQWMEASDAGVQKRSYRLLARCVESEVIVKGGMNKWQVVEKVITRMNETTDKVAQGAKRVGHTRFA
jgi:ribosomal RNA-processing protein 12